MLKQHLTHLKPFVHRHFRQFMLGVGQKSFHGLINKVILSAFAGNGTIVDGVDRTMVVTGKTAGTLTIVEPLGRGALDIIDRTDFGTLAAFDADISIDREFPIGYHPFVKVATYDIGVKPRSGTFL